MNEKVIPCLFTSGNLCFGVLSMILSSQGNFFWGALCIFFAMLCDAMDGRSARALGVSGRIRKRASILYRTAFSFRCRIGFLMYNYTLHTLGWIGVIPVLIYSALGGIRLARFNINTATVHGYFEGMPIPNGGCLFATYVLSGVMLPAPLIAVLVVLVGYDLVSKVHHPDFKGQSADVLHKSALIITLLIGAAVVIYDWHLALTLPFGLYIVYGLINTAMNGKLV